MIGRVAPLTWPEVRRHSPSAGAARHNFLADTGSGYTRGEVSEVAALPSTNKKAKSSLSAKSKPTTSKRKAMARTAQGVKQTSAAAVGKKRAPSKTSATNKKTPGFHGGSYLTPGGNVSLGIPSFWTLRQTNDDLEVESPSGKTAVIVTAFHRTNGGGKLDARYYLESYLSTALVKGRPNVEKNGHGRAISRFRDAEGDHWQVEFLTDGETLLLATMNTSLSTRSQEAKVGSQVLATLDLKGI
jgi:hypothetical protein